MIRELLSVLDADTVAGYRRQIGRSLVYAVSEGVAVGLTLPVLAAFIDDDPNLRWWLIALVAATAAAISAGVWVAQRGTRATFDAMEAVQAAEITKIRSLPLEWFGPKANAALIALLWPGAISITRNILLNLGSLARGLVTPVIVLIFAAVVSPPAALTLLIASPLLYAVYRVTSRTLEESERVDHEAGTESTARIIEFAESQQTLRSAGRDSLGTRLLVDALDELDRSARRGVAAEITARAAFGTAVNLAVGAMVVVVGIALLDGPADVATLIALLTMSLRYAEPAIAVAGTARMLRTSRATVTRTVDFLQSPELTESASPRALPGGGPLAVEFSDVRFSYPGAERPALHGIDLAVQPGQTLAVVGASGAGKSSLLRLVPRFADPERGAIRIGGVDVRDIASTDLFGNVGIVLAEVTLLDRTIRENVVGAAGDVGQDELDRAAAESGLDEVLARLPLGWETPAGVQGANLSGGERQRVQIARIALARPPVVILDEATAALDPISEEIVQSWVASLAGRCTVLVAAHRLHTVMSADSLIVLDDGAVVEQGVPAELADNGGYFARMLAAGSVPGEVAIRRSPGAPS